MTRSAVATVLLSAVLAGCSSSSGNNALPTPQGIDRSPLLTQVTSCGQLETAIEDALVLEMRSSLEQIRKSDYYIGEGGLPVGAPVGMNGPVATPSGSGGGGPTSVSTTNTQVTGVDEADFVQNDGTRIAVLAGGMLHLLRLLASTGHGRGREPEDRRLAAGDVPRRRPGGGLQQRLRSARHRGRSPHLCSVAVAGGATEVGAFCGYWASDVTQITTVDVSDLAHPKVTARDPPARLVPLGPAHRRPGPGGDVRHPALPRRRAVLAGPAPRREHRRSEQGLRRSGGGQRGADPVSARWTTGSGRARSASPAERPRPSPTAAATSPSAPRPPGRVS